MIAQARGLTGTVNVIVELRMTVPEPEGASIELCFTARYGTDLVELTEWVEVELVAFAGTWARFLVPTRLEDGVDFGARVSGMAEGEASALAYIRLRRALKSVDVSAIKAAVLAQGRASVSRAVVAVAPSPADVELAEERTVSLNYVETRLPPGVEVPRWLRFRVGSLGMTAVFSEMSGRRDVRHPDVEAFCAAYGMQPEVVRRRIRDELHPESPPSKAPHPTKVIKVHAANRRGGSRCGVGVGTGPQKTTNNPAEITCGKCRTMTGLD